MSDLIVNVEQGALKGCIITTDNGNTYNAYMGIPYAKQPIGELRFKDPQYPEKWEGILDATKEGNDNIQFDTIFNKGIRGGEDCLFLNVYKPVTKNSKLPVMVWIHGGAFMMGSGSREIYGPDHIVQSDVIVVTINYRLGPFGFLCLNNAEVPGNAGLKDQSFALRWIYKNIAAFGGDVNNITIFGESAGAASVHYQILSPMSKGLFHKAIMQSGTSTCMWASNRTPENGAFDMARDLGLDSMDKEAVLNFLRQVPAEEIIKVTTKEFLVTEPYPFLPIIEQSFDGVESFLTTSPMELMASGNFNKVPTIIGTTSEEGVLFLMKSKIEDFYKVKNLDDTKYDFKGLLKTTFKNMDDDTITRILKKIEEFYSAKRENFIDAFVDILSDVAFVREADSCIKLHNKHHPVYAYNFTYNGNMNLFKMLVAYPYKGASHGDDLSFIFKANFKELPEGITMPTVSESDIVMMKKFITLWTNFAKYGNPTPETSELIDTIWKPAIGDDYGCYEFCTKSKMIVTPYADRINFWNDLLKK